MKICKLERLLFDWKVEAFSLCCLGLRSVKKEAGLLDRQNKSVFRAKATSIQRPQQWSLFLLSWFSHASSTKLLGNKVSVATMAMSDSSGHQRQSWVLVIILNMSGSPGHRSQSWAPVTVGRPGLHLFILRCHRSMSVCYCFLAILFLSVDRFLLMLCGNQSAPLCMAHPFPEAHCPASLIPLLHFSPLLPLAFSCPSLFSFLARV